MQNKFIIIEMDLERGLLELANNTFYEDDKTAIEDASDIAKSVGATDIKYLVCEVKTSVSLVPIIDIKREDFG